VVVVVVGREGGWSEGGGWWGVEGDDTVWKRLARGVVVVVVCVCVCVGGGCLHMMEEGRKGTRRWCGAFLGGVRV
jgi:hypothetical protein